MFLQSYLILLINFDSPFVKPSVKSLLYRHLATCVFFFSDFVVQWTRSPVCCSKEHKLDCTKEVYILHCSHWCMYDEILLTCYTTKLTIFSVLIITVKKWLPLCLLSPSCSVCCKSSHLCPECQANLPFPLPYIDTVIVFFFPKGRHPQEWDESVLCEIQWSNLCQAWEAGYYDSTGKSTEHCTSIGWIERVRSCYLYHLK